MRTPNVPRVIAVLVALADCVGDSSVDPKEAGADGSTVDVTSSDASVDGVADVGADAATSKRVFITSAVFNANLGGASGADAKCQSAATAAGLSGSYRAWVSTPSTSPTFRFTPANVPYELLDGTTIALDFAHLTAGFPLLHAIDRDEHNQFVSYDAGTTTAYGAAWTQTLNTGMPAPFANDAGCAGFTYGPNYDANILDYAGAGCDTATDQKWSLCEDLQCYSFASLYCFEQ